MDERGSAPKSRLSELSARIASAVVLAPIALAAIWAGGAVYTALILLGAGLCFWEWSVMTARQAPGLRLVALIVLLAILVALPLFGIEAFLLPLLLAVGTCAVAGFWRRDWLWIGAGLVYVAVPAAGLILLREPEPSGFFAIAFLFAVVWTSDIAAYFGGRRIGGPKLWARVSPKKTWSGALSGLLAAAFAGSTMAWWTGSHSVILACVLAAAIAAASQAGDLLESAVKRRFGVKDSGRIIPGHGGILDRADGVIGAAALALLVAATGFGGSVFRLSGPVL